MLKLILTLLYCFTLLSAKTQNVFIKGRVENYSMNFISLFKLNIKSNNTNYIEVNLNSNKSYSTSFFADKPSLYSLFYDIVFINPGDTVDFNYSFLTADLNSGEHKIAAITRYPGNYLYYHFLSNELQAAPQLKATDSSSVLNYYYTLKNFAGVVLKTKIDSFLLLNKISPAFSQYLEKEKGYYFLCLLLNQLRDKKIHIETTLREIIDLDISKIDMNDEEMMNSMYSFTSSYLEYYTNYFYTPVSSTNYYSNAINIVNKKFRGICREFQLLGITRIHYLAKPFMEDSIEDSLLNYVISNLYDAEIKQSLTSFLEAYARINEKELGEVLFVNKKNKIVKFKDIIRKKNSITYLDFWASWCGPCIYQSKFLPNLVKAKPDIQIIGLSIDTDKDAWLKKLKDAEQINPNQYIIKDTIEYNKIMQLAKITTIPRFRSNDLITPFLSY